MGLRILSIFRDLVIWLGLGGGMIGPISKGSIFRIRSAGFRRRPPSSSTSRISSKIIRTMAIKVSAKCSLSWNK